MISELSSLIARFKVEVRVKQLGVIGPSAWSPWLTEPEEGYFELKGYGPIRKQDIEWIEINPLELKYQGRLVAAKEIDHSAEIQSLLEQQGISFLWMNECILRIWLMESGSLG